MSPEPSFEPRSESPVERKIGHAIGILAVAIALAGALYGVGGMFTWGHHGYHAAQHSCNTRQMIRHGIYFPLNHKQPSKAPESAYYLHHPVLIFQYLVVPMLIFGDYNELALRTEPIAFTLAILLAIFFLGRRLWGSIGGGVAALVFSMLPITLAFNHLVHDEQPGILYSLLGVGSVAVFLSTPSANGSRGEIRWLVYSIVGFFLVGLTDWPPYLMAFVLFLVCMTLWLVRRDSAVPGAPRRPPYGYMATLALTMVTMAAFHFGVVEYFNQMGDLRSAFTGRAGGSHASVYKQIWEWMSYVHTKPLLILGLAWLALLPVRAVAGLVRSRDLIPVVFGMCQLMHTRLFPTEAAIHIYRTYYLTVLTSFAVCDLTVFLLRTSQGLLASRPVREVVRKWAPFALAALVTVPLLAVEAQGGVSVIRESRRLMGALLARSYTSQHWDLLFYKFVREHTAINTLVLFHTSIPMARWEGFWYLDREWMPQTAVIFAPPPRRTGPTVLFVKEGGPGLSFPDFRRLLREHRATRYGSYYMIELNEPGPNLTAYNLVPEKSSALYKYFVSPYYPRMKVERDVEDEWRLLVGAGAKVVGRDSPPKPKPHDLKEMVIYHNANVLRGDDERVAEGRALFVAERTNPTVDANPIIVDDDVELLGYRFDGRKTLELMFRARRDNRQRRNIVVLATDSTGKQVAIPAHEQRGPAMVPTDEWRKDLVYIDRMTVALAPGTHELKVRFETIVTAVPRRGKAPSAGVRRRGSPLARGLQGQLAAKSVKALNAPPGKPPLATPDDGKAAPDDEKAAPDGEKAAPDDGSVAIGSIEVRK